jgi:transposase
MEEVRLVVTDAAWEEIAEVLQEAKRPDGRRPVQSDRMFLEAVLYGARTGVPWRDLPPCFGRWDAVYNRFRRWEKRGVWRKLWEGLQHEKFTVAKHIFIDSTIVRAHQHAAGALKNYRCKSRSIQEESAVVAQRASSPCKYADKLRRACHAFLRSSVRRTSASAS